MANFDLRTFLTENKLTRVSRTLVTEAMSMNDLDSMKIVTDEYLAQKGIKVNPTENGSGQRVLDMLNPPHVSTIETDEDEAGAESYDVYDLGDGHFLVIDDYEGQFAIYRKVGGIKAAGGMNEAPANEAITEGDSFDYSNLILSTINSLTDMGEEGENALRVLGKISDWNEVVRLATEE
jgi:hypothetical protein